ncbi:Protein of unknown function [Ruminococcaceae bacterium FB2012]|nr:Protein of unknown function [Ruminococcaceae bacterium FB2012]
MSRETTEFVIYIINEVANTRGLYPSKVYKVMESTGCISKYLIPFYDVLHSMSSQSVVEDVLEYVTSRGESL